jgi:hypothetical protein
MADRNEKPSLEEIFLSIVLSAAASYVLSVLASIDGISVEIWLFLTSIIVTVVMLIVIYILNLKIYVKSSNDYLTFIKTIFIGVTTITLFSIARFISFYANHDINILEVGTMYTWMCTTILVCCIVTIGLIIEEYRHKNPINYLIIGWVIFIILTAGLFIFKNAILYLRGVVT